MEEKSEKGKVITVNFNSDDKSTDNKTDSFYSKTINLRSNEFETIVDEVAALAEKLDN